MKELKINTKIINILLIYILLLNNCTDKNSEITDKIIIRNHEVEFRLIDCNYLINYRIHHNHVYSIFYDVKPKDVVESIFFLDSNSNSSLKHALMICDVINFHMDLGLSIRNYWIKNNNELMIDLKKYGCTDPDNSSIFIMNMFKMYLIMEDVDILSFVNIDSNTPIYKLPHNYIELENNLNKLKDNVGEVPPAGARLSPEKSGR